VNAQKIREGILLALLFIFNEEGFYNLSLFCWVERVCFYACNVPA